METVLILALSQLGAVSLRATEPVLRGYADNIDVIVADGLMRGAGSIRRIELDGKFVEALKQQRPLDTVAARAGDDLCRIVFSSGTTGTPKGVPFSVDYLTARVDSARRNWIPAVPFMSLLGLDTVTGFQSFMWAMMNGETYFAVADAARNLNSIREHGVAAIKTSPARLGDLVEAAEAKPGETALTVIEVAGSLLPATVAAKSLSVFGVVPTYLYGSTEVGTVTRGAVDSANPAMVGTLVDEIDAEIVDDNGTALPRGIEGMLRFRKPGMPNGYWNVTAPTGHSGFRDGWFYPGDYGQIDGNNRLWLSGRRDDLVNAGGAKFNLIELDQWLQDCGLFLDAASFQFVNNRGEKAVGIGFVTKNAPEPTILSERLREFLPDLQFGALVRLSEIPRNQLGKVNRTLLSEKLNTSKGQK
jgi:acyl-coenzyme A synthetase/AMP-(fatty) acid ligase